MERYRRDNYRDRDIKRNAIEEKYRQIGEEKSQRLVGTEIVSEPKKKKF